MKQIALVVDQCGGAQLLQVLILLMHLEGIILIIILEIDAKSRMLNLGKVLDVFNAFLQVGHSIYEN